jgi:hypothetical protein
VCPTDFEVVKFLPARTPAPCFLFICNREREPGAFWPVDEITDRGYATAAFQINDVAPDVNDGKQSCTVSAWAWGASRALDRLASDPAIDARRVAVVGHSRAGKASLWCGAQDERFAMVVSNESGCTGAAMNQKRGEQIKDINERFPHWFSMTYKQYNDRLPPVDQDALLALIAPRLLYVASASEDLWADPEAEFRALRLPVPMPGPDQPLHTGRIGYHVRTGKHDLTPYDWNCFMDFADRHWQ